MSKHVSPVIGCQLGCTYCYEEPSREITTAKAREEYNLDDIFERLDEWKDTRPHRPPGLHGGEPLLLPKSHLRQIFEYIDEHWEQDGSHIQTNGTLIDDDHIEIFKEFNVHVGVSCDGPEELNEQRKARQGGDDVTGIMTQRTHDSIDRLIEENIPVGIIVVLHESNAGTDVRLEKLLDWIDYLNRNGVYGHYNPAIPYEDVQEDISLSPERLKEVYIRTWEWMMEPGQNHRTWNPMRRMQNNLLGLDLGNCINDKCDVYNAGAAKIIKGDGETTGCGKTWDTGDGIPFLQGESTGNEYGETEERYEMLKQLPGNCPHDDGEEYDEDIDLGGLKGCRYWAVTQGGCPSAGLEHDYRNRSIWHEARHALYHRIENDMRRMFPAIRLVTDFRWDDPISDIAKGGDLDIKPFANIRNSTEGEADVQHGESQYDSVYDTVELDESFDNKVKRYKEKYPNEIISIDPENKSIHADSA